jgi:hypothetical protein
MGTQRKVGLVAVVTCGLLILGPIAAQAQKAGPQVAAPAHPAAVPALPAARRIAPPHSTSTTPVRSGSTATLSSRTRSTPHRADLTGLGNVSGLPNSRYTCPYSNPISCDLPVNSLIDPVTQLELAQSGRIGRNFRGSGASGLYIFGGGYYVPAEPDQDQGAPNAAEQAEGQDDQRQPEEQQAEQNASEPGNYAEDASPSVRDEGQFTLVLNDGTQIQALAFSHSKDKIVYITPEGGRASVPFSDLDADATVRVNQERGTPLQLPL